MLTGLLLTVLAGLMNGSFPVPMRYMRRWAWENIWTVYSVVALLLVPWSVALFTVPSLFAVFAASGPRILLSTLVFGLLWGIAGFLFGLSVELVGMSLTFAIVNGLGSAIGSWVPLIVLHTDKVLTAGGIIVSVGVLGTVGGVAICSWAGQLRFKATEDSEHQQAPEKNKTGFWRGLALAITSGILGPSLNLGIAFSGKISAAAVELGTPPALATNSVVVVLLTGGFISNIIYCTYRLLRNQTMALFAIPEGTKYFGLGTVMGLLWAVSYTIYASSTSYLGKYGPVVGWPIIMAVMTIASSLWDVSYGDWKKGPLRVMALGVALLIGAVAIISYGMFRLHHGS